jgi:hypothetical protein
MVHLKEWTLGVDVAQWNVIKFIFTTLYFGIIVEAAVKAACRMRNHHELARTGQLKLYQTPISERISVGYTWTGRGKYSPLVLLPVVFLLMQGALEFGSGANELSQLTDVGKYKPGLITNASGIFYYYDQDNLNSMARQCAGIAAFQKCTKTNDAKLLIYFTDIFYARDKAEDGQPVVRTICALDGKETTDPFKGQPSFVTLSNKGVTCGESEHRPTGFYLKPTPNPNYPFYDVRFQFSTPYKLSSDIQRSNSSLYVTQQKSGGLNEVIITDLIANFGFTTIYLHWSGQDTNQSSSSDTSPNKDTIQFDVCKAYDKVSKLSSCRKLADASNLSRTDDLRYYAIAFAGVFEIAGSDIESSVGEMMARILFAGRNRQFGQEVDESPRHTIQTSGGVKATINLVFVITFCVATLFCLLIITAAALSTRKTPVKVGEGMAYAAALAANEAVGESQCADPRQSFIKIISSSNNEDGTGHIGLKVGDNMREAPLTSDVKYVGAGNNSETP